MRQDKLPFSRRQFFKTAAAAGAGALLASGGAVSAAQKTALKAGDKVPTRQFGRSRIPVSILSLGGMFDIPNNQLLLKQAVRWGVTYWDTADCYGGGASEEGIGKYFRRQPEDRQQIFLVTKSDARDPEGMTRLLDRSLERMKTGFIDLYFVHGVRRIGELDDDTRRWAEKAKADGKIRLFGFSTHSNMERLMIDAARLRWIDGIMMSYNFRLMHTPAMKEAVAACKEAGIGLTAMKTQGGGQIKTDTETEMKLAGRFLKKGFTDAQARLKAVWDNPDIASICSQMPNMTILMANVAAAVGDTALSMSDHRLMARYDRETAADYCAGCSDLCESALAFRLPIGEVMRCLMYSRSYGDPARARRLFSSLPPMEQRMLAKADFSAAERCCPRAVPIGRLMKEAAAELG
ncbi:MAG: aldo/keto reductase [Desulfobacterales bacterium]|nr:aldo/keto reductase [Desulfobacterales bacterium]